MLRLLHRNKQSLVFLATIGADIQVLPQKRHQESRFVILEFLLDILVQPGEHLAAGHVLQAHRLQHAQEALDHLIWKVVAAAPGAIIGVLSLSLHPIFQFLDDCPKDNLTAWWSASFGLKGRQDLLRRQTLGL
jgi:hypothetical protein